MAQSEEFLKMQLQCPLPKLNYKIVTLGHGSGGILTHRLLDDIIFKALGDQLMEQKHDGALLPTDGQIVFTTDSFVVSPITFPGGNIGDLAVNGTLNDLAMCGARPEYLSLAFIIEEGFSIQEFWDVLIAIRLSAMTNNVKIVTGDTKVVDRGSGDKLFINTSGIGTPMTTSSFDGSRCLPGDSVIVSGCIASHGMAIMSVREGLEFESTIKSDTRCVFPEIEKLIDLFGDDIRFLRDPTRGGIGTVLTELAQQQKIGIDIAYSQLPILPEVSAACEILGIDPIYVANEGIFMMIIDPAKAEAATSILNQMNTDQSARIIGSVTEVHPGKVLMRSAIGGQRVINMLVGQQLPRIC